MKVFQIILVKNKELLIILITKQKDNLNYKEVQNQKILINIKNKQLKISINIYNKKLLEIYKTKNAKINHKIKLIKNSKYKVKKKVNLMNLLFKITVKYINS